MDMGAFLQNTAEQSTATDAVRTVLTESPPVDNPHTLRQLGRAVRDGAAARPGGTTPELVLGVVSTCTPFGLPDLLAARLSREGIRPHLHVAERDPQLRSLADPDHRLTAVRPTVTVCQLHHQHLLAQDWTPTALDELERFAMDQVRRLAATLRDYCARTGATVVVNTVPLPAEVRNCVLSWSGRARLGRIWREVNAAICSLAEQMAAVYVADLELRLVTEAVTPQDPRLAAVADIAWTLEAEDLLAHEVTALCRTLLGHSRKSLVLDLDGTLWDGVLGDDGPHALRMAHGYPGNCHAQLQRTVRRLSDQGVVLAIASKNSPGLAADMMASHPDLLLRPADFAAMQVNWDPKPGNIRTIAQQLGLGLDSLVFADDSAFERASVTAELPSVQVVDFSGSPETFTGALLADLPFDVLDTTAEDRARSGAYRARQLRAAEQVRHRSATDYLSSLDICVRVGPPDAYTIPRLVQLAARTNQFNMTGHRYTEAQTNAFLSDGVVLAVAVSDRFGDEGITGAAWITTGPDTWSIENFVLSCRVLSRGVELAVLQAIAGLAAAARAVSLSGRYVATERNEPARQCYPAAGFTLTATNGAEQTFSISLPLLRRLAPSWITSDIATHSAAAPAEPDSADPS